MSKKKEIIKKMKGKKYEEPDEVKSRPRTKSFSPEYGYEPISKEHGKREKR